MKELTLLQHKLSHVEMADANRDAAAFSPPTATRGRLSEEDWHDVRRAARIAREEGVWMRVFRGKVWVAPLVLKQHKKHTPSMAGQKEKEKPTEAVAPTLLPAEAGDSPPKPPSNRQRRSKQRLLEHLEKKRAEQLVELVSKGTDIKVARGIVAREESKRLERIAAQRAAPVDVEAASAEGHPSGEENGQPRSDKRMRLSPPEAG